MESRSSSLACREAEGDVEEAAVVQRSQADQPAIGRAGDVGAGADDGEALVGLPVGGRAGVSHRTGTHLRGRRHRAGIDLELGGARRSSGRRHCPARCNPLSLPGRADWIGGPLMPLPLSVIWCGGRRRGDGVGAGGRIGLDRRRQRDVDIAGAGRSPGVVASGDWVAATADRADASVTGP
jgi:hypothetical protein